MATDVYSPFPRFSFDEYLARNARSNEKLEYLQGVVYSMAGGTQFHNAISINFAVALGMRLRGKDCSILSSDQMIEAPGREAGFYPDLSVLCGAKLKPSATPLKNPFVVVEVLSPSTRDYDLGQKFQQYRRIASLRHIVFIDSEGLGVQVYTRGADEVWPGLPETHHKRGETMVLSALEVEIPLVEIYGDLDFAAARE